MYIVSADIRRAGKGRSEPLTERDKTQIGQLIDSVKPLDWWGDVGVERSGPATNHYTAIVERASDAMKLVAALNAWASGRPKLNVKVRSKKDEPRASDEGIKLLPLPSHLTEVTDDVARTMAIVDEVLAEVEAPRKRKTSRRPRRRKTSRR